MTKRTSSISNRYQCGHCRKLFYAFGDEDTELCPVCREALAQLMTAAPKATARPTTSENAGESALTRPWQLEMRFS